jgi:hypothetical protein
MKTKLFLFAIVAVFAAMLVSCGPSKDEQRKKQHDDSLNIFVGIWKHATQKDTSGTGNGEYVKITRTGDIFSLTQIDKSMDIQPPYEKMLDEGTAYSYKFDGQVLIPVDKDKELASASLVEDGKLLIDGKKYIKVKKDSSNKTSETKTSSQTTPEQPKSSSNEAKNRKWESVNFYKDGVTEYIEEKVIAGNPDREFYYYTSSKPAQQKMPVDKMDKSGSQTTYYAKLDGAAYKLVISGTSFNCIDSKGASQGYTLSK